MKLELEVYDLGEKLFYLRDNRIEIFQPNALKIISEYQGYSGDKWGDYDPSSKGGFPIEIYYSRVGEPFPAKEWINHKSVFRTKQELLDSL